MTGELDRDFRRFLGRVPVVAAAVGSLAVSALAVGVLRWRHFGRVDLLDSTARGLGLAALAAASFAAIAIAADLVLGFPRGLNVPWPRSLAVYPVMAVVAEVAFHLAPLAMLILALDPAADGELGAVATGCLIVVALIEAGYQARASRRSGSRSALVAFVVAHVATLGFLQLLLLWGHGLVAMVAFRLVYYGAWHIAWGALRLR